MVHRMFHVSFGISGPRSALSGQLGEVEGLREINLTYPGLAGYVTSTIERAARLRPRAHPAGESFKPAYLSLNSAIKNVTSLADSINRSYQDKLFSAESTWVKPFVISTRWAG